LSNIKLYDATTGEQIGSTVASFDSNNDAEFNLTTPWVIPAGETKYLVVKADVNAYPNAVSGSPHTLEITSNSDIDTLGLSSGQAITGASEVVSGATSAAQDVYKTKVTVAKNASSPSGSAVAGAGQEVLRFDVTADSNNLALLSAVALTISGGVNTTGSGNAYLYDASDLSTPLKIESYKEVTATGGSTTTVTASAGSFDNIPVGATIRIYDNDQSTYMSGTFVVESITTSGGTDTLTFSPAATNAVASGDKVYYRPLQPGSGKLYFGAHTTLAANVDIDTDTKIYLTSVDGFATGETVTVKGYSTAGVLQTETGVVAQVIDESIVGDSDGSTDGDGDGTANNDKFLVLEAVLDSGNTAVIDYDYLDTAANALGVKHTSRAIVYEGSSAYGSRREPES